MRSEGIVVSRWAIMRGKIVDPDTVPQAAMTPASRQAYMAGGQWACPPPPDLSLIK